MRIYLIGFMGTGKTTLGGQVAGTLKVPFFDTDIVIESQFNMSISGIFALEGEKIFRELEADVLRQTTIYEKALISTGGGLPCFHGNMEWMNAHGVTIYLSWPEKQLKLNLLKQTHSRPVFADLSPDEAKVKFESLVAERKPFYELAAMTLELEGTIEKDKSMLEKACKYIW